MKKTLALFGLVAGALMVPSLHATPDSPVTNPVVTSKASASHPASKAARSQRATYYITSVEATGSHLPLVVCRYQNQYYSQSPGVSYGPGQLDRTGQLNVASELYQRDPAISSASGRH